LTRARDTDEYSSPICKISIDGSLSVTISLSLATSEFVVTYEHPSLKSENIRVPLLGKELHENELPQLSQRILFPVLFLPLWLIQRAD